MQGPTDDLKKAAQKRLKPNYNSVKGMLPNYSKERMTQQQIDKDVRSELTRVAKVQRTRRPVESYLRDRRKYDKKRGF